MGIDITFDNDSHQEAVSVKSGAFVTLGDIGKPVCGFKGELFVNFHVSVSVLTIKRACRESDSRLALMVISSGDAVQRALIH